MPEATQDELVQEQPEQGKQADETSQQESGDQGAGAQESEAAEAARIVEAETTTANVVEPVRAITVLEWCEAEKKRLQADIDSIPERMAFVVGEVERFRDNANLGIKMVERIEGTHAHLMDEAADDCRANIRDGLLPYRPS